MSTARELLIGRRRELQASIAPITTEINQIDAALMAMDGVKPTSTREPIYVSGSKAKTVGDQLLAILGRHGRQPTAFIADHVREEFGRDISNKNVSWHLTRLKREGLLLLENDRWAIAQKEESPEASTSEPSSKS